MNRLLRGGRMRALSLALGGALLCLGVLAQGTAHAACTRNGSVRTAVVEMNVGRVVVPQESAVGDVLVRREFPIQASSQAVVHCAWRQSDTAEGVVVIPGFAALGDSVYQTNIRGIGIRLSRLGAGGSVGDVRYPHSLPISGGLGGTSYTLAGSRFVVEIIKTESSTGSGALTSGTYSSYRLSSNRNNPMLDSRISGEAITIISPTCSILGQRNQTINLAAVPLSGFSGVGSTQGEVPFSLDMRCNGGSGISGTFADVYVSFAGNAAPGTNASQGVLRNEESGGNAASGIGIQMLDDRGSANTPIALGETLRLARLNANEGDSSVVMQLLARYYQTQPNARAGKVHAIATYNVTYQ